MFSIASDISFPRVPVSVKAIAVMPVNNPGPNALNNKRLQISVSTALKKSKNLFIKTRTTIKGLILEAATNDKINPKIDAIIVPNKAIVIVSNKAKKTGP